MDPPCYQAVVGAGGTAGGLPQRGHLQQELVAPRVTNQRHPDGQPVRTAGRQADRGEVREVHRAREQARADAAEVDLPAGPKVQLPWSVGCAAYPVLGSDQGVEAARRSANHAVISLLRRRSARRSSTLREAPDPGGLRNGRVEDGDPIAAPAPGTPPRTRRCESPAAHARQRRRPIASNGSRPAPAPWRFNASAGRRRR